MDFFCGALQKLVVRSSRLTIMTVRPEDPNNHTYAKPVVWMLVRDAGAERTENSPYKEQMRTELGCGILNNETRNKVQQNGLWSIGLVVGIFETMQAATAFLDWWKLSEKEVATRGPTMRMARGMELADTVDRMCWMNWGALTNSPETSWVVEIIDGFVYACRRVRQVKT